ncbi:hypothetical protein BDV24DRAFT_151540 [Aspergillus arachidicola]|uniref:Uncharacterized protein n=1 Tax=Aspergillus arachidicola TaxID=656916 RepID=A0A5N6Y8T4_9EURO|nr:hypothetical protein BDV24DRAFT_151540 [Aspergillus arachidicola]
MGSEGTEVLQKCYTIPVAVTASGKARFTLHPSNWFLKLSNGSIFQFQRTINSYEYSDEDMVNMALCDFLAALTLDCEYVHLDWELQTATGVCVLWARRAVAVLQSSLRTKTIKARMSSTGATLWRVPLVESASRVVVPTMTVYGGACCNCLASGKGSECSLREKFTPSYQLTKSCVDLDTEDVLNGFLKNVEFVEALCSANLNSLEDSSTYWLRRCKSSMCSRTKSNSKSSR